MLVKSETSFSGLTVSDVAGSVLQVPGEPVIALSFTAIPESYFDRQKAGNLLATATGDFGPTRAVTDWITSARTDPMPP